jgi:peroxiredoxin
MIAFFAPCCSGVMMPTYLAVISGGNRFRVARLTAIYVAGVAAVVLPITLGAGAIGQFTARYHPALFCDRRADDAVHGGDALARVDAADPDAAPAGAERDRRLSVRARRLIGAATACCAPVLAGAVALSALNQTWVGGLALGGAYLMGDRLPAGRARALLPWLEEEGARPEAHARTRLLKTVSSGQLVGKPILYHLSESVMCQACLVQIQALQQQAAAIRSGGLQLVSVTNDDAGTLRQAAHDYKITTPLIADDGRSIVKGFGVLGGIPAGVGMHSDTADHTFILVDSSGKVRFVRDSPSMWIDVNRLLAQLPMVN